MDIHRCRFVDYPPSSINALAFSHPSGSASRHQPVRLAIGRANGNIEIWDPRKGTWIHEITLYGGTGRTVEGLVWVQDPDQENKDGYVGTGRLRLFSIGYSSTVTEWDLLTGLPARHSSGSHSEVWCLAAQPRLKRTPRDEENEYQGQDLVVGCADGSLILLSTGDGDLAFRRYIFRGSNKNSRALSIAFQNRHTIAVGFADSTVRVFDIRSGNVIRTMSLGSGSKRGPKETLVWALQCLKDGTIVSGDSTGHITFWDGGNYAQLQKLRGHEVDILCLASTPDGRTVFSGGMDRRTAMYSLSVVDGVRKRWSRTSHSRTHEHDIKAMASFENKKLSMLVAGGLDTSPTIIPMRSHGKENHRKLPYTPQTPAIGSAKRLLLSWWNNEMTLWRLKRRTDLPHDMFLREQPNHTIVAQLALKGDEHISSATLSPSGRFVAVATVAEVKFFVLQHRSKAHAQRYKVSKLDLPRNFGKIGARVLQFSPDSKWLSIITPKNEVSIVRIVEDSEDLSKTRILSPTTTLRRIHRKLEKQDGLNGSWGSYRRTITRMAFSAESNILAVSDLAGYIDSWILQGHEDLNAAETSVFERASSPDSSASEFDADSDSSDNHSTTTKQQPPTYYSQHWTRNHASQLLVRLPCPALVLSFRPSKKPQIAHVASNSKLTNGTSAHSSTTEDRLLALTAEHTLHEYHILTGTITDWSRRNPTTALPAEFKLQRDRAVGCVWDIQHAAKGEAASERVWLYSASWLAMLDLSRNMPQPSDGEEETAPAEADGATTARALKRKRKRDKARAYNTRKTDEDAISRASEERQEQDKDDDSQVQVRPHQKSVDAQGGMSAALASQKHTSGAGSRIAGSGTKVRRLDTQNDKWIDVDMEDGGKQRRRRSSSASSNSGEDDEEDDEGTMDELATFRRSQKTSEITAVQRTRNGDAVEKGDADDVGNEPLHTNGAAHDSNALAVANPDSDLENNQPKPRAHFFITTKYRPILGIAPLAPESSDSDASDAEAEEEDDDNGSVKKLQNGEASSQRRRLEVALVERPFWDLDLPGRIESEKGAWWDG